MDHDRFRYARCKLLFHAFHNDQIYVVLIYFELVADY